MEDLQSFWTQRSRGTGGEWKVPGQRVPPSCAAKCAAMAFINQVVLNVFLCTSVCSCHSLEAPRSIIKYLHTCPCPALGRLLPGANENWHGLTDGRPRDTGEEGEVHTPRSSALLASLPPTGPFPKRHVRAPGRSLFSDHRPKRHQPPSSAMPGSRSQAHVVYNDYVSA